MTDKKKKTTKAIANIPESGKSASNSKSAVTKRNIVSAARRVFSRHPYYKASIRMIAAEGGFHFSLINHYFSKSQLFGAVAKEMSEELLAAFSSWLKGLDAMSPEKGLSLFLDRALDYFFKNPDVLLILMKNAGEAGSKGTAPGFDDFSKYVFTGSRFLVDTLGHGKNTRHIVIWFYGMLNLMINFVGAAPYHCQVLNMDPKSDDYRHWVKESLMYLFLPQLQELLRGPSKKTAS